MSQVAALIIHGHLQYLVLDKPNIQTLASKMICMLKTCAKFCHFSFFVQVRNGLVENFKHLSVFFVTILYLDFGDCKPFESIWHQVLCPLVTAISNVRHKILAFKLPPNPVVYSLWFTPVGLHQKKSSCQFYS